MPNSNRSSIVTFALLLIAGLVRPAAAQLRTELVADGFVRPVAIVPDPLSPSRLIVAEHRGLVWVVENGLKQPTPMLDVSAQVQNDGVEQGFLGIVVHPSGDRVFVTFSRKRSPDAPPDAVGDTVLRRYRRSPNPAVLDPATAKDLLIIPQVYRVHKGGDLHFLVDHLSRTLLYMSVGDGGGMSEPGNAQDPQSLRGKMLRLDVDVPDEHPVGYVVPPDNPFVDGLPLAARGEIWAFGYRNPWRFSIDDLGAGRTGALIVGDVGEFNREEIDYEPFGQGGRNYGWFIREGTIATPNVSGTPAYQPLSNPIADYGRDLGRSITGGYVYRGTALPDSYRGRYFFADFFGRVFSLGLAIGPTGEGSVVDYIDHTAELGNLRLMPTFGRDSRGELYVATFGGGAGGSGRVLRFVTAPDELPAPPTNLSYQSEGSTVLLEWDPASVGGAAQGYQLEAGSQSGLADLLVTRASLSSLVAYGVPDGRYFVRVRSYNRHGASAPSNELMVQVGCTGPPAAPTGLAATVGSGGFVTVTWSPAVAATSYVLEAGYGPGLSNAVNVATAVTSVQGAAPPATYYARVRSVSSRCGISTPSQEIVVTVP
jgi:glucose/arabinose dehydrogenase